MTYQLGSHPIVLLLNGVRVSDCILGLPILDARIQNVGRVGFHRYSILDASVRNKPRG